MSLTKYALGVLRRRGCSSLPEAAPPWGGGGGGVGGCGGGAGRQRRGMSGGGSHKDGVRQAEAMTPAEIEELSVFNAVGGLAAAAVGGIAVFVIGAGATLGVASGAAAVLGHTMNSKRIPSDESSNPAVLSREDLMSELAALRRESRSKDRDVAKAEIKKKLQAMGRA